MPKNILLVGFMGAGKTTVGKILADRLGWRFLDLDRMIEGEAGQSIPDIFSRSGESVFRDFETEALRQIASSRDCVIATGGGIVGRDENWTLMDRLGTVVYLDVPWNLLLPRLQGETGRPLATAEEGWGEVRRRFEARLPLYRRAPVRVDCRDRSPEEVAREIIQRLAGSDNQSSGTTRGGRDENH